MAVRRVAGEVDVVTSHYPVPGFGLLPVNAFVLHAREVVLVDTGSVVLAPKYLDALRRCVPLEQIRFIWLTHTDPDHVGCLRELLDLAPEATLVTTFVGLGKLGLTEPIPPSRVRLLNPGQMLDVGDRRLVALRPPTFDAPETTAVHDEKSGVLFSADCFGGIVPADASSTGDIEPDTLRDAVVKWATVDAPWLSSVPARTLDDELARVRQLAPRWVLSSHLPPAEGMLDVLLDHLARARTAPRFVGPDQAALERMLAA